MSEKLYYITAKNKGEKPYVMFLNWDSEWSYTSGNARILDLHIAKNNAAHEPTHCLFVEATDGLQHILSKYFEEEKQLSYKVFNALIKEHNCETESTRKEKMQTKAQAKETSAARTHALYTNTNDGQAKFYCSDKPKQFVVRHSDKQKIEIMTKADALKLQGDISGIQGSIWNIVKFVDIFGIDDQNKTQAEPQENKTDKELFVAYRILDNNNKYYYLNANHGGSRLINGQFANIFNRKGIDIILKRLNTITPYVWICDKIEPAVESETPVPKADSESKELSEGYIVYTQSAYQPAYIYYCGDDAKHLDERNIKNAVLFPYVTAVEVAKKLAISSEYSGYTWRVKNKINAAKEEMPALEAKKRVAYVLFGELLGGDKVYKNETKVFTMIDGSPADVYMTKEQADFVAYTFNTYSGEFFTWQVERVEF